MVRAAEMLGHVLLFLLVFGMSATVDLGRLRKQSRNSRALLAGVALQFVVLPFLGFLSVKALGMDDAAGMMILVVTSSPGGSFSNWWCSIFNADLALSVTMTAISTVLALVMLPLNLCIYTPLVFNQKDVDVMEILDFGALASTLVVVIGAIGLGIYTADRSPHPKFHVYANRFGSAAGVSLVVLSGVASTSADGDGIWQRGATFYAGVAAPCVVALLLSNLITSYFELKKPERVTTCVECCYQNCGIAASVALSMFADEDDLALAMGVPFLYGIVEFLVIGTYCLGAWKAGWTKAPPGEPLWKVLTCSYEVLLDEKLTGGKNDVEVRLSRSSEAEAEVTDEYRNEGADDGKGGGGFMATCLYYCHEPDPASVDPTAAAPSSDDAAAPAAESQEREEVADDSYVIVDEGDSKETAKALRPLFWRSLGYKVPQE